MLKYLMWTPMLKIPLIVSCHNCIFSSQSNKEALLCDEMSTFEGEYLVCPEKAILCLCLSYLILSECLFTLAVNCKQSHVTYLLNK